MTTTYDPDYTTAELARLSSADRVRALRTRLGLTQEQLAHKLGVTTNAVARWERGTRSPIGLSQAALERLEGETR